MLLRLPPRLLGTRRSSSFWAWEVISIRSLGVEGYEAGPSGRLFARPVLPSLSRLDPEAQHLPLPNPFEPGQEQLR